jgi:hypothetical protein
VDRTRSQARDRRYGQDQRREQERALDRVRDQAKIRQLAKQWRAMEEADHDPEWSHAFGRHRDISEEQLATRAATGELPDGQKKAIPRHATKWRSDGAMVVAADGLARSDDYRKARAYAEASGQDRFKVVSRWPKCSAPAGGRTSTGAAPPPAGPWRVSGMTTAPRWAAGSAKVTGAGTRSPAFLNQATDASGRSGRRASICGMERA